MEQPIPAEELAPLTVLAELHGMPLSVMRRISDKGRENGFPKEVEKIGRIKFYRRDEVARWMTMWKMTSRGKQAMERHG